MQTQSNTIDQSEDTAPGGNTKSSRRSRNWFFTYNGYCSEDIFILNTHFRGSSPKVFKAAFQEEQGESGNPHLQGVISYQNARTFDNMKKFLPKAHWEVCKDLDSALKYCTKKETRVGKVFTYNYVIPKEDIVWREYQQDIINLYHSEPGDRIAYWYYEETGNVGKTTLAREMCIKHNDIMYINGKASDVKYAVKEWNTKIGELRMVIYNIPRSNEQFVSYQIIEELIDAIFFSPKYESGMHIFKRPHIVVFANFKPTFLKLSLDRWKIIKIVDFKGVEEKEEVDELKALMRDVTI